MQQPLPLWVGGTSPAAKRRAARHGTGWLPNSTKPDDYVAGADEVRALAVEAGRDPSSLTMAVLVQAGIRGEHGGDAAHTATIWADDADAMRTMLQGYRAAGVDHVVIALGSGDVALLRRGMLTLASILPDVR